jgi:HAD superfamily phosphoserine phosphatase-like hydrolase
LRAQELLDRVSRLALEQALDRAGDAADVEREVLEVDGDGGQRRREAIARDKSEGRRLVLATASYRLYADAIAKRLGFDDVIGTGSVIGLDERIRSRIEGENAYGEAKLRMIAEWVEKSGLTGKHGHVRFYSDHASDAPTFEWADEPIAVNPHARLARLAIRRGWPIEDWG